MMPSNYLTPHIDCSLEMSPRLFRLCKEVVDRLPAGWDENMTLFIEESPTPRTQDGQVHLGSCLREEEMETPPDELPEGVESERIYSVKLYGPSLETYSDPAIRWVIAHELAHAASGLRFGSIKIGDARYTKSASGGYIQTPTIDIHEDSADTIAMQWGFTAELQGCLAEMANDAQHCCGLESHLMEMEKRGVLAKGEVWKRERWNAPASRLGPRGKETFLDAYPKVHIKVYRADGPYRVQSCLVWLDNSLAHYLGSGEKYESREAAIGEMKQQTMNLLWERRRRETEHDVNWEIETEIGGHASY